MEAVRLLCCAHARPRKRWPATLAATTALLNCACLLCCSRARAPPQALPPHPHRHYGPLRRYFPTILIVIMALFNDGAMIALSKDRVVASKMPNSWNITNIFVMGMVYGLYLTLSSWCL